MYDPNGYTLLVVLGADKKALIDFTFEDHMAGVREERALKELGFEVERYELSTSPLFESIGEDEMELLINGSREAY